MEKAKVKFFIDILMFLDFLILAISGFVLWKVLSREGGRAGFIFILGRGDWLFIHDWSAVALVVLIIIHHFFNWNFIKCMIKSLFYKINNKINNKVFKYG